jgi:hypothetical protein
MQIANATKPQTIGELRKYLDLLEANWSQQDDRYLGVFADQTLYAATPEGVGQASYQYLAEFGLVAILKET